MTELMAVKIQQADVKNRLGRIWPSSVLSKLCGIKRIFGTVNGYLNANPASIMTGPEFYEVSHTVSNLRLQDGWLVGDVEIHDTPFGKLLEQVITKSSYEFALRSIADIDKATGTVKNFIPISIDAVSQRA